MALTFWNDLLNKPEGLEELPLKVSDLSASVLDLAEDVGEIARDVGELAEDVGELTGIVNNKIGAWSFVGTITNLQSQDVPNNAKEILLCVYNSSGGTQFGCMVIPCANPNRLPAVFAIPFNATNVLAITRSNLTLSITDGENIVDLYYR